MSFEIGDEVFIYYDPDEITGKIVAIHHEKEKSYQVLWDVPENLASWQKESDLVRRE